MSEDARGQKGGLIGPNAVLQLLPVLEEAGGTRLRDAVMAAAGIDAPPSDAGLMPEGPAARLHQALRRLRPDAAVLAAQAGARTGDYILAHRIPAPAQRLLRALPPMVAAPLLSRAIAKHAWTFAGSGRFRRVGARAFEIAANPVVAGEQSRQPLCHWHAALFERLYRVLVDDRLRCTETACCACGDPACRFELRWSSPATAPSPRSAG